MNIGAGVVWVTVKEKSTKLLMQKYLTIMNLHWMKVFFSYPLKNTQKIWFSKSFPQNKNLNKSYVIFEHFFVVFPYVEKYIFISNSDFLINTKLFKNY